MKMKKIWSLTETKLFCFHGIFKNGGGGGEGGGSLDPPEPLWIRHWLG